MTFQRDLAWQNLDLVSRSSVAYQFARYALRLNYKLLPPNVVHQAKRCLLDTLGCAIGAYDAPGRSACEGVAQELQGPEEATVFCSGLRTSAANATLVNSFLVRFLDYNDCGGGGHNSDSLSSILAVAEREKANGSDFLTSVVICYELGERVRESVMGPVFADRGWCPESRAGLITPPALGKLMGLTEDQIANAIGICASHSLPLGVLDSDTEENTMSKNLRFGFVAYNAVLSCMLAKRGFTGPVRVVEGDSGFNQVIVQGEMDLERLTDFSGWRIMKTKFKPLPANYSTIAHVLATLAMVKEHDLKPEDIAALRIFTQGPKARHCKTPSKKYPKNAESADHSLFYTSAIAIKERSYGPESFDPEKFTDPVVLDLIEKITVEHDPSLTGTQGIHEITTRDGHEFQERFEAPPTLTDRELEDKFRGMASKYMDEKRIQVIFNTVWNLENLDDIGNLSKLMAFKAA
jgi:2-methylcitrate dehydratase